MHIQAVPADEAAVRRWVESLWLPYHRELEATVDSHALADDVDLVAEEVEFRCDRLADDDVAAWVAVAGVDGDVALADGEGVLVGFVTTERDEPSSVFDRPVRLVVGDLYVETPYRGTGLARDLMDRAAERARDEDCTELALDVDVDNERAIAFYEKLVFEPRRHRMTVPVADL